MKEKSFCESEQILFHTVSQRDQTQFSKLESRKANKEFHYEKQFWVFFLLGFFGVVTLCRWADGSLKHLLLPPQPIFFVEYSIKHGNFLSQFMPFLSSFLVLIPWLSQVLFPFFFLSIGETVLEKLKFVCVRTKVKLLAFIP